MSETISIMGMVTFSITLLITTIFATVAIVYSIPKITLSSIRYYLIVAVVIAVVIYLWYTLLTH